MNYLTNICQSFQGIMEYNIYREKERREKKIGGNLSKQAR
jgi:hypothetical protein